tara:strand:- start:42 stop:302 length:261 start_codon:yes stop_codon:yes gene_type:complete
MRFLGFRSSQKKQAEFNLLQLKVEILEKSNELLLEEIERLNNELNVANKALEGRLSEDKAAMQALESLMKEFDMMALESMEPIGDA